MSERFWDITLVDGALMCARPSIALMTPYVFLEQEDWFEDEIHFVRKLMRPDMCCLDIGANHGVYAITMARRLVTGHVYAFEPTKAPRAALERARNLNGVGDRLTIVPKGLSNRRGRARIGVSDNSELNSLHGSSAQYEDIELDTLDHFMAAAHAPSTIDFVKLDAEGEEVSILEAGASLFEKLSPLVMFELKHGDVVNNGLIECFSSRGYGLYTLVPAIDALIPFDPDAPDSYLLNLFAAKPDRARKLIEMGLMAAERPQPTLPKTKTDWRATLFSLPGAATRQALWMQRLTSLPPVYQEALAATMIAQDGTLSPQDRLASLLHADACFSEAAKHPAIAFAASVSHLGVLAGLGLRDKAVQLAQHLFRMPWPVGTFNTPFVPPVLTAPFMPGSDGDVWLRANLLEFLCRKMAFSTYFSSTNANLISQILVNQQRSPLLDRLGILWGLRSNLGLKVPALHPLRNPNIRNGHVWQEVLAIYDVGEATAKSPAKHAAAPPPPTGRNVPCPCGSGKKYKHCHGQYA